MTADLLRSPLHARHEELGAKFAEFGGFSMPLQYGGIVAEHTAVRERVGVFDVSHLGTATVTGPGARAFVDQCFTNALERIEPGRAQYTLCCNDDGGVVDDLIVYLRSDEDLLLVPNAANNAEVVSRLQAEAPEGVEVANVHRDWAVLAVQGPASAATLAALGLPTEHPYMSFAEASMPTGAGAIAVTVCRSGYTGERGYELLVRAEDAVPTWDAVLAAGEAHGIAVCGLGARDTLRTEMGYPLHGQDLGPAITPLQGRSAWAVGWDKPRFWGRDALVAERAAGPARRLRGIRSTGRGIPRPGMAVRSDRSGGAEASAVVGEVTSGTFSPTLKQGVGLALLDATVKEGEQVLVDIRGRQEPFDVVRPPFVETSS